MIILIFRRDKETLKKPPVKTPSATTGHAWETGVSFRDGAWHFSVAPGFVNGIDPRVPRAEEAARKAAKQGTAHAINPRYSRIGGLIEGAEIGLLEQPEIKIEDGDVRDPRAPYVTQDGAVKSEVIPPFFYAMGLKKPKSTPDVNVNNFDSFKINLDDMNAEEGPNIVKCDIWLAMARATTKLSVDLPANLVTGQLVDYSVGYDTTNLASKGSRARLLFGPRLPEDPPPSTFEDRLAGAFGDVGEDRVPVATIYWLSPVTGGKSFTEEEDGIPKWTPFIKHNLFYNLCYKQKNLVPRNITNPGLDLFTAWFVGRYTFAGAATVGAIEAEQDRILSALWNDTDGRGDFWTA
jgi:hypothetical protein